MPPSWPQRGVTTLVVVLVLFLVMGLLAAYANRILMFEQRIAGSYYRASLAQEMAEGGLDWTVAMLNGGAINNSCAPVAAGGTRFVNRYLDVSAVDRATTTRLATRTDLAVDCAETPTGLVCRCPAPSTRTAQPSTALSGSLVPSVGVALGTDTDQRYGSFVASSYGCSDSSVDNCYAGPAEARSQTATAMAVQHAAIAFISAVPSSPAAPLTVKGSLTTTGVLDLGLHNTDPRSGGVLVVSGGPSPTPALSPARLDSVPGTPPSQAGLFADDYLSRLSTSDEDNARFFRNFMGMRPARYQSHPAARVVACPNSGDCGPNLVSAVSAGQRMLTVPGAMAIGSNVIIGTPAAPVVIVVYGPVAITGPMQLNGMLVVLGSLAWTNNGGLTSQVTGMVVVQGDMVATGHMDILYQQAIADELRNRVGSYARVSGGWIDATLH
ncbi:PilX N-terminal domain-containing pilus assembly protein [Roseateles sp. NT4]|uniref:PilX N-terminal domain-containing pilus assembly protein n=1 Tax=Roseateles sp. NT4 TaxID=3453715 RepID=UPI003EEAC94B